MPQSRPTVERRQLGTELRRLRDAAGKSQREAAESIGVDTSLISRMERGLRSVKTAELNALLHLYGAPRESRDPITGIAQLARQRQPRRIYSDALPGAYRRLIDHEQDATEIYYSDSDLIPGLLQTEEYMRALMRSRQPDVFDTSEEDIESRVQFRLERQKLLRGDSPPRMWFVIGEAALHRPIGRHSILHQQLLHLLRSIEEHANIVIQVAPLSIVDHPLLGGAMQLMRFGSLAPDIVQQPTLIGGGVYVTDENDIAECARALERLQAVALGPEDSRVFLTQRAEELNHGL